MALSEEQVAAVEQIYVMLGEDESGELDLVSAIRALESAEQLHLFIHNWNWDSGTEPLVAVINHLLCDKGTALRIFWLTDPVHFFQSYHSRVVVKDWEQPFYDLVVEVRDKFKAGFYKSEDIYFNPEEAAVGQFKFDNLRQEIPQEMRLPTAGRNIDHLMVDFGLS